MTTTCPNSCEAEITFYRHERTGNTAPIELSVRPDGNVTIDFEKGTYHVLTKKELAALANPGLLDEPPPKRFVLHFAECPNASGFRSCRRCHKRKCVCPR